MYHMSKTLCVCLYIDFCPHVSMLFPEPQSIAQSSVMPFSTTVSLVSSSGQTTESPSFSVPHGREKSDTTNQTGQSQNLKIKETGDPLAAREVGGKYVLNEEQKKKKLDLQRERRAPRKMAKVAAKVAAHDRKMVDKQRRKRERQRLNRNSEDELIEKMMADIKAMAAESGCELPWL